MTDHPTPRTGGAPDANAPLREAFLDGAEFDFASAITPVLARMKAREDEAKRRYPPTAAPVAPAGETPTSDLCAKCATIVRERGDHTNRKWIALTLAFSALGKQMTGLPIDFQVQQQTYANATFGRKGQHRRSALGIQLSIARKSMCAPDLLEPETPTP